MDSPLIELRNVGVAFSAQRRFGSGKFWALEDVTLNLRQTRRADRASKRMRREMT